MSCSRGHVDDFFSFGCSGGGKLCLYVDRCDIDIGCRFRIAGGEAFFVCMCVCLFSVCIDYTKGDEHDAPNGVIIPQGWRRGEVVAK